MGNAEEIVAQAEKLLEQRRLLEAADLLSPWLTEYPDDARAWELLVAAHLELQDWPRAQAAAGRVLRLTPPQTPRFRAGRGSTKRRPVAVGTER